MIKFILLSSVMFCGSFSQASSFIGNGGNAADLDLAATMAMIADATEFINYEDVPVVELCIAEEDFLILVCGKD